MKKTLRNLALATSLLLAGTTFAQNGIVNLTEGWNYSTARNNIAGTWFVTGTPQTRTMAVKDDKLFVATAATYAAPTIDIIDCRTGDKTGNLSVEGISGGTWLISHLEVLGNDLIGSSFGNPSKVYRWKDCSGKPELWFSYPCPTGYPRFGENFGVYGDEKNGKIMFVATSEAGKSTLFVFNIVDGVVNTTPEIITPQVDYAGQNSTNSALYYGNDQYLIITKAIFPALIDKDGKQIATLDSKLSSNFGSSGKILTFDGKTYFAGVGTKSSGYGKGVLDVVDITDGIASGKKVFTLPADADGLGSATNAQVVTDVEYSVTDDGATLNLFVLVPAQGVAMYSYTDPAKIRNHHAYNLQVPVLNGNDETVTLKFHCTGDAPNAYLHFNLRTPENNELRTYGGPVTDNVVPGVQTWEVGPVTKGENTVVIPATWFARTTHDWEVEIVNYPREETKVTAPVNVGGARAAVACFTDPEFPEVYGYTVIGRATNTGIDIYDPCGNLVQSKIHPDNGVFGGKGATNPCEATTRGTEVYFASWNDKAYGVVAFDITTPEVAPYSVFEGDKATSGLITYNETVQVGSGTPGVAIWGEGEQTSIVVFDEDIFKNKLARNIIGTAKTTHNALELVGHGFEAGLLNTTVSIAATANGVFVTQQATNGMLTGALNPDDNAAGLRYISMPDGKSMWYSGQEENTNLVPTANGGVDVNRAGDRLALSTYKGVNLYSIEWNGNTPKLTLLEELPNPDNYTVAGTSNRTIVKFDAAGNIHALSVKQGYYVITPKNSEGARTTAVAPKSYAFTIDDQTTGVEDIVADGNEDAAVYYNLNGVRVAQDNLTPGVYVKVVGTTSTKVIVK